MTIVDKQLAEEDKIKATATSIRDQQSTLTIKTVDKAAGIWTDRKDLPNFKSNRQSWDRN